MEFSDEKPKLTQMASQSGRVTLGPVRTGVFPGQCGAVCLLGGPHLQERCTSVALCPGSGGEYREVTRK